MRENLNSPLGYSKDMFKMIVACTRKKGIGMKGGIPWHLGPDLNRFKELTVGSGRNAVVMGRQTWESLPDDVRPLRGRENVILSRQGVDLDVHGRQYSESSILVAPNKEALMDLALSRSWHNVWIIGGESVYKEFMGCPCLAEIYLTEVDIEESCDRFFPRVPDHFDVSIDGPWQQEPDTGLKYRYLKYVNRVSDLNRYL